MALPLAICSNAFQHPILIETAISKVGFGVGAKLELPVRCKGGASIPAAFNRFTDGRYVHPG